MGCLSVIMMVPLLGWLLVPALLLLAILGSTLRGARQIRRGQQHSPPPPTPDQDVIEVTYEVLPEDVSEAGDKDKRS